MDVQQGIVDHLLLTGIATSGVVLSTEVHRVLTEKVFPRQADVVRIADW
jgi:hypothetical protein